jgi:hypothetical protein
VLRLPVPNPASRLLASLKTFWWPQPRLKKLVYSVFITAAYGRQTTIIISIFSSEAAGFVYLKRLRLG